MTLYEFVRRTLDTRSSCTRDELLNIMMDDQEIAQRLADSQGFSRLLNNMKQSGFIELEGKLVRRTKRRVGKRRA